MIAPPILDSQKEALHVSAKIKERHWPLPAGLSWVLFPIAAVVIALITINKFEQFTILAYVGASIIGLIVGLLAAFFVANRIPDWNDSRRRNIVSAATAEFHQLFEQHNNKLQRILSDLEQFEKAVKAKSYRRYEGLANSLHKNLQEAPRSSRFPVRY